MATHSSILAWKIPWTEKPGGLQSMGLQKAGHNWATNTFISIFLTLTCGNTFIDVSTYLKLKQTNRCSRWTQEMRGDAWTWERRYKSSGWHGAGAPEHGLPAAGEAALYGGPGSHHSHWVIQIRGLAQLEPPPMDGLHLQALSVCLCVLSLIWLHQILFVHL